jgi:ComF family protein
VDRAIQNLKYRRQLIYAPAFADLLAPLVSAEFPDCDALVPVPLHRLRRWRRGFNQATEIARYLACRADLPLADCAVRIRATSPQSGLPAADRRANVARAFRVTSLQGSVRPLVIDDVITTGATAEQLAVALKAAGAETVAVIAVARSG